MGRVPGFQSCLGGYLQCRSTQSPAVIRETVLWVKPVGKGAMRAGSSIPEGLGVSLL